jgi:hypothetical protein
MLNVAVICLLNKLHTQGLLQIIALTQLRVQVRVQEQVQVQVQLTSTEGNPRSEDDVGGC